ncbi:hypothetical protein [Streptomyces melanogenes]|uniref:Uncharacterized protein n=1 Tax=Streptomyces melanogenes TaxID=67326 RepID=A0ABZ1XPB4_9ACTN|nr:hypothetical protein [Streptomyces melanogenes]
MNAEEARHVEAVLRHMGLPGVVAPDDPENPAGPWRVYDQADPDTRQDTTADALVGLAQAFHVSRPLPPGQPKPGPTRGFVIPPKGD